MITNFSTEDILQNSSPEQRIIWNRVYQEFGLSISISPYLYEGTIGGSEFLIHSPNKIYLAYEFEASYYGTPLNNAGYVEFYDKTPAALSRYQNIVIVWNATATLIQYLSNPVILKNKYFSRIAVNSYTWLKFIGFRIGV